MNREKWNWLRWFNLFVRRTWREGVRMGCLFGAISFGGGGLIAALTGALSPLQVFAELACVGLATMLVVLFVELGR